MQDISDRSFNQYKTITAFTIGGFANRLIDGSPEPVRLAEVSEKDRARLMAMVTRLVSDDRGPESAADADESHTVMLDDDVVFRDGMGNPIPPVVKEIVRLVADLSGTAPGPGRSCLDLPAGTASSKPRSR